MSEIKYGNFKIGYLQIDIQATRKNVTNYFRINICYALVHAKTTLSVDSQKM